MLRLREATAHAEHAVLEQERRRRAQLEAELQALKESAADAGRTVKAESWVRAAELANFGEFTKRIDREIKEALMRIAAQDDKIRSQERILTEARRSVRLLEMLRDKRVAEWRAEADRESNAFSDDFIAAQSARQRRDAD